MRHCVKLWGYRRESGEVDAPRTTWADGRGSPTHSVQGSALGGTGWLRADSVTLRNEPDFLSSKSGSAPLKLCDPGQGA